MKKYLESLYGSPLILSTDNCFGIVVEALLSRPTEDHNTPAVLRQRFDKYTTPLEIFLPDRNRLKRKGFVFTDKHTLALNKFFERQFCEQLLTWCELGVVYKVEFKKNIEEFCWRYKINIGGQADDDISFDALKKKEYRFRKKNEEKKQPVRSSETFVLKEPFTVKYLQKQQNSAPLIVL
ncbi:MAG TPA: hypothetical protein VF610_09885 [Segetibacter sp.]